MRIHFFLAVLIATAASGLAEKPKKTNQSPAASAEPIVGTWKRELKGEDTIYTFKANGAASRHRGAWHEEGRWRKLEAENSVTTYQCVMNGGAMIIKINYLPSPEHLSLHPEDSRNLITLKRLQLK